MRKEACRRREANSGHNERMIVYQLFHSLRQYSLLTLVLPPNSLLLYTNLIPTSHTPSYYPLVLPLSLPGLDWRRTLRIGRSERRQSVPKSGKPSRSDSAAVKCLFGRMPICSFDSWRGGRGPILEYIVIEYNHYYLLYNYYTFILNIIIISTSVQI
jgi:hypothetical protein